MVGTDADELMRSSLAPHCLTRNLTVRFSRKTSSVKHFCIFNQIATLLISLRQKDRKHRACVSRGRFLLRQSAPVSSCSTHRLYPPFCFIWMGLLGSSCTYFSLRAPHTLPPGIPGRFSR